MTDIPNPRIPPDDDPQLGRLDFLSMGRENREILVATQLASLTANMTFALKRLDDIEKETAAMSAMANRWKGATFVLLGLGSTIGWLISLWGRVSGIHS